MQCPKCNTEIPEGCLYCPKCGEEIIIVSDFDIKLEDNIDTTVFQKTNELPDVKKELSKQEDTYVNPSIDNKADKTANEETGQTAGPVKVISKPVIILIAVVFLAAIGITVFTVNIIRDYTSYEIQYTKAKTYLEQSEYDKAVKTAKHTINIDESEIKGYVLLSDVYCAMNNYDAAIAVLYDAMDENGEVPALYDRIVKCYEAEGDYASIQKLVENSDDESLKERYSSYFPAEPVFSLDSGEYSYVDPIVLTASEEGSIYYTTDGTDPTADSLKYEAPIPLEDGENIIKAVFINSKGMMSLIGERDYVIKPDIPETPVMLTQSGSYNIPNPIGVEKKEGLTYYYTTSSEIPTAEDNEYNLPLFMPIGKSEFTFIAVNEAGLSSESVTVSYELNFSASIEKSVAEYAITYHLMEIGDAKSGYSYKIKDGYIQDGVSYYIVYEMNGDSKTGRIFAVNSSEGSLYWVLPDDENNTYKLTPI